MGEDLRLHHEIVTVDFDEDAVESLMKLVAMGKSNVLKPALSHHGAEVNKLTLIFPCLN